jgi:hypothetical protein
MRYCKRTFEKVKAESFNSQAIRRRRKKRETAPLIVATMFCLQCLKATNYLTGTKSSYQVADTKNIMVFIVVTIHAWLPLVNNSLSLYALFLDKYLSLNHFHSFIL